MALTINRIPTDRIDGRVLDIAGKLNITDILDKYPYQVSGGQKQRCACARAIINQPKLILADEPTGALDSHSSQMLLSTLRGINEELGATILMVTHDAFSASYANRILFLRDGKIFTEILKGSDSRTAFFEKILNVLTMTGGACLLILAGVYGLHRKFPLLLYQFAKQNPRRKYKGENLFFLGQIGRRIQSAGRTMAVVSILLTISLAAMFVGLTTGAGYKANMEAYYPYDAGVAIDAPFTKASMDSVVSFVDERYGVEDSVTYYLYTVPDEPIEALSLSDYNHLRTILGLSTISMGSGKFLIHCDTWNYLDEIEQALEQQPELKSELNSFLNSGEWTPEIQVGHDLPKKVTMGVTVKAWGVANSLTGFTAISFCGMYLSIIFIILSCAVLAFEQLSAIDKNQKNYEIIERLGVSTQKLVSLIRRELSTMFFIPLFFPLILTVLLIAGTQLIFGEAILQEGLVLLYGLVTLLVFCSIYLLYFGATLFLFKRVILGNEKVNFWQ